MSFTNERRLDLLVGALEGGSNYWYYIDDAKNIINESTGETFCDKMFNAILAGKTIEIQDIENENDKLGEINLASISKGEKLMLEYQPKHYADIVSENDDAITADVWFQYCVLGELIYG